MRLRLALSHLTPAPTSWPCAAWVKPTTTQQKLGKWIRVNVLNGLQSHSLEWRSASDLCAVTQAPLLSQVCALLLSLEYCFWKFGLLFEHGNLGFRLYAGSHKLKWLVLLTIIFVFLFPPPESPLVVELILIKRHPWCVPSLWMLTAVSRPWLNNWWAEVGASSSSSQSTQ